MQRRKFLSKAGAGMVASAAALPGLSRAQASALPTIKWRLTSSFSKNLDTVHGATEGIAKRVAAATGGKFEIKVFAANEIIPALQALDAVQKGTVECCHSAAYYYFGKDPTFAFGCTVPFGMNTRQQNAWMYYGGGMELMREFYKTYDVINFPAGNTGAQMGGWFNREINTVADLKGLKFRIGGFAGRVLSKLGVIPQQIAAPEIYPAMEKHTIDAAEWVGPYDDEKLGLNKVAKFYYYPGWWEGNALLDVFVNLKAWEALPAEYKAILEAACAEANVTMCAKYDAVNPVALKRLYATGTKLRPFSQAILDACMQASEEVYAEESAKNPAFKKIYTSWKAFRDEQIQWFRVCEENFDNYMAGASQRKAAAAKK